MLLSEFPILDEITVSTMRRHGSQRRPRFAFRRRKAGVRKACLTQELVPTTPIRTLSLIVSSGVAQEGNAI